MGIQIDRVWGQVYRFPIALDDRGPDLLWGFSPPRQLVGKHRFLLADVALRAVLRDVTIEQALVSGVPVAIAVAWLLVQNGLDLCRKRVNVAIERIGKLFWVHGHWK